MQLWTGPCVTSADDLHGFGRIILKLRELGAYIYTRAIIRGGNAPEVEEGRCWHSQPSPTHEIFFSGELSYTTITIMAESLTVGSRFLARTLAYKYLK
jgi:hypothetical protein